MSEENELPEGWVTAKLQDIAPPGGTRNPQVNGEGEFLYVDIEAVDNTVQKIVAPKRLPMSEAPSRARMAIQAGDVIFSLVRPYLKNIAIVPQELDGQVASTAYCVMRPARGIVSSFVFYTLLQESFINSITTYGNSPPSAHDDEFLAMSIPLAPTNEQKRIVAAIEQQFTRLDAGVAALQQAKAKLKRYRAAVLKAAVEGKLTEAWRAEHPTTEPASLLLERILKERRAKWEADLRAKGKDPAKVRYVEPAGPDVEGLPELPAGWCWARVEQIAQIQGGIQKQPSRTPRNNAFPYLRVANVFRGRLDLTNIEKMELFGNELDTLRLITGDLLIVEGNGSKSEIGRSALWKGEIQDCVHQNHIIRVRLSNVIPEYLDYYWNSPEGNRRVMDVAASTSGLYTLSVGKISRLPVPLPSLAEQEQIVAEVERRLSVISQLEITVEANLKRAERLRQSILREAFAGRLVPQDPNDEPASVLLERIRGERGDQRKNGLGVNRGNKGRSVRVPEPGGLDVVGMEQVELWGGVGG